MSRSTTRLDNLEIGVQYEDREHGLIAYIDGLRPSVKRNAIATAQLRQEFSEWLEAL